MFHQQISVGAIVSKVIGTWAAAGVLTALALIAVGMYWLPTAPANVRNVALYGYAVLWPTSLLVPTIVDSVQPSRTYMYVAFAAIGNAVVYAAVGAMIHAVARRRR